MKRKPALPRPAAGGMDPNDPQPGYWLVRLRRGAPPMPACIKRIWHEPGNSDNVLSTGPILVANIGWEGRDPLDVWTARRIQTLTRGDYEFQMARISWVRKFAPDEPEARPATPVDVGTIPPVGPSE